MPFVPLRPAPAGPVAPVGPAAPVGALGEARAGIGSLREVLSVVRDAAQTWKEVEPFIKPLLAGMAPPRAASEGDNAAPPQPERFQPREFVQPVEMRVAPALPPPAEARAAAVEEERVLREGIKECVRKLNRASVNEIVADILPFALLEKRPDTAQAIADNAPALLAILATVPDADLHAVGCVVADNAPASKNELGLVRNALLGILKRQESKPAAAPPADEPKKEGGA